MPIDSTSLAGIVSSSLYIMTLLALAAIDLKYGRLPNVIIFPVLAVALVVNPWPAFVGAAVGLALFLGLYWLGRRLYGEPALGMGDVKLAMLLGAMLGIPPALYALALGMLLAGAAAVVVVARRTDALAATLPYGAFLSLGGLAVLVWQLALQ